MAILSASQFKLTSQGREASGILAVYLTAKTMRQLHYIQLQILKKLLFNPELKFSELRPAEQIENNQLVFHIEQLLDWKLINKTDGKYKLTIEGKEYANRMDTDDNRIKQQAKLGVIMCCYRELKGKKDREYLMYTRKKHPFYDHQGFNSGKIMFGENVIGTAQRELKEETNLEGEPELFTIEHHHVFDKKSQKLVEDKFFFFMKFANPKGELKANDEGLFEWVPYSKIAAYLTKPFESADKILEIIDRLTQFEKDGNITFHELEHWTEGF